MGSSEMADVFEDCAGAVTGRSWTSCTFVAHAVPGRRLCSWTAGAVPSRISASTARWCDRASGATWVPAVIILETTASLATILYAWASASSEYWHIPVVGAYFTKPKRARGDSTAVIGRVPDTSLAMPSVRPDAGL